MKAKDLLREIVKAYPDVVAIARDENKSVYLYSFEIPKRVFLTWDSNSNSDYFSHQNIIEWDSENWKENIVTINDL